MPAIGFSTARLESIEPQSLDKHGRPVFCKHAGCGARLYPDEVSGTRNTPCCNNGAACQEPLGPLPDALTRLMDAREWPRLCLRVNSACSFAAAVVSGPPVAGKIGAGIRVPFSPPCTFRLEGSIHYHVQPLAGEARAQNPSAGPLAKAACSWWLSNVPLPAALDDDLQDLIHAARAVLVVVHPGADHASYQARDAIVEQGPCFDIAFEEERLETSTDVVAIYRCLDSARPPVVERVHWRDSSRRPLPPGLSDVFAFPILFPKFRPFLRKPGPNMTRMKWMRFHLFQQHARFTMSPPLFQAFVLSTWNEVEAARIFSMLFYRKQAMRNPADAPEAPSDHLLASGQQDVIVAQENGIIDFPPKFQGGPTFYKKHIGCALFAGAKLGFDHVLFTTLTCNARWPAAEEMAGASRRPSASQSDNRFLDTMVRGFQVCSLAVARLT